MAFSATWVHEQTNQRGAEAPHQEDSMTQAEFNKLVTLDIQRLVAKAQAEYEAKTASFNYDAPYNPEFLGAQPARAGEDY